MKTSNAREFDLESVLTVTTFKMLTKIDNLYDLLNYLTGEDLYIHQLPRAGEVAIKYILELYPSLVNVDAQNVKITNEEEAKAFVKQYNDLYGEKLTLSPMPKERYESISPIVELDKMMRK